MKAFSFILLFLSILLFNFSVHAQVQEIFFKSDVAEIYKGSIEDAADYIASFPTDEEAEQILNKLNLVSEEIRAILYGEVPPDTIRIKEITDFVLNVINETDILLWNILEMHENQRISLLPGEGIKLTLHSYCLNHDAASPSDDEFYYIDAIPEEQSEWLIPVTDYISKHPGKDFPAQGLIWNMNNNVAFDDLPADQQELLVEAIPGAEELYRRNVIDEVVKDIFDPFKQQAEEEVESLAGNIEVIDDISEIAEEIENRVSELKLVIPKYKTYQLPNGLLIKAESTGSYSSIILTIVNPRPVEIGYNINQIEKDKYATLKLSNKMWNGILNGENVRKPSLKGKWKDRLRKLDNLGEKCDNARHHLQEFDKAMNNPESYAKGRAFDDGLQVFKDLNKGNADAQRAFDMFSKFNHGFIDAQQKSNNRPGGKGKKSFSPSDFRFKPGRDDVQPLKPVFGCG